MVSVTVPMGGEEGVVGAGAAAAGGLGDAGGEAEEGEEEEAEKEEGEGEEGAAAEDEAGVADGAPLVVAGVGFGESGIARRSFFTF